jgi:HD-like signal output (HDOD) protein
MNPAVFELSVSDEGVAESGYGVLAAYVPADANYLPLVVAGCDPRHDPGKPIESLAGPVFAHVYKSLGKPAGLRWVVVDNWGRFFEATPHWATDPEAAPILEFKRFPDGVGVDAFTKEIGPSGEAGLELLSAVIEGSHLATVPTSVRQFLEAIQAHGNLPAPGALFQAVSTAAVTGDIRAATQAIQLDPVISATLINYANAAAFANAGKTGSVSEAVQRLGINHVRRVVFIAEMMARYQKGACREFDYRAYWHNAIATGAAMRGLMAEYEIPARLADDVFTTGLLSGIGWLAIAETFPGLMADYVTRSRGAEPIAKMRLQQEIFPCPVNRVTETYLARFDFPETVQAALSTQPSGDGWAWFDCLAAAVRGGQGLAPFDCLAVPTGLPVPEPCRDEWQRWKSLLAIPSAISS